MRLILYIFTVLLFLSCSEMKSNNNDLESNYISNTEIPYYELYFIDSIEDNNVSYTNDDSAKMVLENIYYDLPIYIEFDTQPIVYAYFADDMRSNVIITYFPESGVIQNIEGFLSTAIYDVFEIPILNKNVLFPSQYTANPYFNGIADLINQFGVIVSDEDIDKLNNSPLDTVNKITIDELHLYVIRIFDQRQKLFIIEYENNSNLFDFNVKIGIGKDVILERFGEPTYYNEDGSILIYTSFNTFRELNFLFDSNILTRVQLISFLGA